MRHSLFLLSALAAISLNVQAAKDEHSGHGGHAMPVAASTVVEPTDATVKKVDPASGKVTLSHGPLKNLGMPAMTMAFKVKDAKALAQLKAGDKIRFVAEHVGHEYQATSIEKLK